MEKIITIGGRDVRLSNNLGWAIEYKNQFGKDVLETMIPIISTLIETFSTIINETGSTEKINIAGISEAVEGRAMDLTLPLMQLGLIDSVVNVTWAMAKAADDNIAPPDKWARQFDEFPLDIVVPEVGLMMLSGFTSSKNLTRLRSILESMRAANQPESSTLTRSFSQESSED